MDGATSIYLWAVLLLVERRGIRGKPAAANDPPRTGENCLFVKNDFLFAAGRLLMDFLLSSAGP